jgi:hypothetical protein
LTNWVYLQQIVANAETFQTIHSLFPPHSFQDLDRF